MRAIDRRRALGILFGTALGLRAPRWARAAGVPTLGIDELYASFGPLGLQFSDRARQLRGRRVAMDGFMAPPLKPEAKFFVLTRRPVALCPFCQSDADWPSDIVVVITRREVRAWAASERMEIEGTLELGSKVDAQTGFVSQVRLADARVTRP